jgi:hypothetical protein
MGGTGAKEETASKRWGAPQCVLARPGEGVRETGKSRRKWGKG